MTRSSDSSRPDRQTGPAATEDDVAGAPSPAGNPSEAPRDAFTTADAGLASFGEALNGGQAPQLGADRDGDAADDETGGGP